MRGFREEALERLPGLSIAEAEPMASHTTLRLGGPADVLAQPRTEEDIRTLLEMAAERGMPVTVIGRGSNLLVRDGGVRGLVLLMGRDFSRVTRTETGFQAQAGISLHALAEEAAAASLQGLAFASGIPGTLGGAVRMNAGAYGGEMSQVVEAVSGIELATGARFTWGWEELAFDYRRSALQRGGRLVTEVLLRLTPGEEAAIRAEMAELNRRRAEKQPLDKPSAGSTFKRPADGYASQLIDACGLKGLRVGGAQVSPKHAGFLVNEGGTTADFLALMARVRDIVEERCGIRLEPEVEIIGEDA